MKTGQIILGASSCELRYSSLVPAHLRGLLLEIINLLTDTKQQSNNHASALMQEVCQQADQDGIVLMIVPKPFANSPMSAQQLQDWYERRFGFGLLQADPAILIRLPQRAAERLSCEREGKRSTERDT